MHRISVRSLYDHSLEKSLKRSLQKESPVSDLKLRRLYWVLEKDKVFADKIKIESLFERVFFDPLTEECRQGFVFSPDATYVEVRFLAGVTDNVARSATEALMLLAPTDDISWQDFPIEVHSGWELEILGDCSKEIINKTLLQTIANPLLNKMEVCRGDVLLQENSWMNYSKYWFGQGMSTNSQLELFDLNFTSLNKINADRGLALSEKEIETIIAHFSSPKVLAQRKSKAWDHKVTDVELECIAQTWSEHCKHKIFAADIDYTEAPGAYPSLGFKKVRSLYKSYIQKATKDVKNSDYLVSVFKDNAGIVDFDSKVNVCVKVETHNSPSALDPFGGALTGILGVHRDIMGCGLGAKPIANTDVFCLSTNDLFPSSSSSDRPELLKDPSVIFRGVHQGVEEGGNQSGIPTVNGSVYFASEFAAKPLIFVGSVGVMPKKVGNRVSEEKQIQSGDLVVVAGGRLGKDGVHGATFSSLALYDHVASNVVQIGDSITQKRLLDFTLQVRDRGLIRAITDNGAGGLSSSVGEMAQLSGGARIDLSLHPLKYEALEYWEMLVSESQERMTYAVAAKDIGDFLQLAKEMNVEASVLGEFTKTGLFEVLYKETPVAELDLHFLHEGLAPMQLTANFEGPKNYQEYFSAKERQNLPEPSAGSLLFALKKVLASPNVASREPLVRSYDHEVQGASRVKPYGGKTQQGANDAGVIDLAVHGGEAGNALAISNGLCPQYSYYDTYLMAQKAVDESLRNLICAGADPDFVALVDNFCWPDPLVGPHNSDAGHKLAQLVRACEGLYDAAVAFSAPFVSGKDSMKNDFIGKTKSGELIKISVPPTLLVTAIGKVPEAHKVIPGYFTKSGDGIYVLGRLTESLYASVLSQEFADDDIIPPEYPDLKLNQSLYKKIHEGMQLSLLHSCHDISEGGMMAALAECCFGNSLGMKLNFENLTWNQLWSETGSLFVVSVAPEMKSSFEEHFQGLFHRLGQVVEDDVISWSFAGQEQSVAVADLQAIWSRGVKDVYEA